MTDLTVPRQHVLVRRVRLLVYLTIGYNLIEGIIALIASRQASSSALLGFGLDSLIEVSSAAAVVWQFRATDHAARERTALRVIAISFFALAVFVSADAIRSLLGAYEPSPSAVGIALTAISIAVMPALSYAQRRTGRELGSRTAVADSKQTLLCAYLSGVVFLGLVTNGLLGWTWADSVAALFVAALAVKEGREAWQGDSCCAPRLPSEVGRSSDEDDDCCAGEHR